jgi:hypothetical protein
VWSACCGTSPDTGDIRPQDDRDGSFSRDPVILIETSVIASTNPSQELSFL